MADKRKAATAPPEETATPRNIHQRLLAVMAGCGRVAKDGRVTGGGSYRFASHDAVTSEVRPHLIEHGVLVIPSLVERLQDGNRLEALYRVRFSNVDDPQDFVEVDALGYGIDTQDKGPGKAASYAVKYALLKVLSLPTGDDPERDQIEHAPAKQRPATVRKAAVLHDAERQRIKSAVREAGIEPQRVPALLSEGLGRTIHALADLVAGDLDKAIAIIEEAGRAAE